MRRWRTFVIVFLTCCVVGIVTFQTGVWNDISRMLRPAPFSALSESVKVRGMVDENDLGLSRKEIRCINYAVLKHKDVFKKINLLVDLVDKHQSDKVKRTTPLEMVMKIEAEADCVVQSWKKTIIRDEFATYVARYLNRAALELTRYLENPELKGRIIKKLYI